MEEIWKDIGAKGFEGRYQVSSLGNIRSSGWLLANGSTNCVTNRKVDFHTGYGKIQLCKNGKKKTFFVHRLVAISFLKNPENKPCVNHINNITDQNNISNLEWCTHKENTVHALKQGRLNPLKGSLHPHAIVNEEAVIGIKFALSSGLKVKEVAAQFKIRAGLVYDIKNGRSWKHIPWPKPQDD